MIMAMIISVAVHFSVTAAHFQCMPQSVKKRRFCQNVEKCPASRLRFLILKFFRSLYTIRLKSLDQ